ncbi:MAG TPA: aromatic ring-hydroxylating dioxygenase subunit alpha [Kofleriaceae bacterium]|nr:aromatic ring-hydroxylating dioxygenase subunit alpha [Kofleriaceae bacterium]
MPGDPDSPTDPIEAVLADFDAEAPLERASTIPGTWYTDPRIASLERAAVWSRTWQLVGRTAQVARPGEFVTAEVAGEPIVVVRGHDGVLRGFFNVCRHHAAAVMTQPCGKVDRLRCPYHGWTYDLAGQLRGVPELDGVLDFDRGANSLVPVHVATWESFVFVYLDPAPDREPPPLAAYLGAIVDQVATLQLGALAFYERREYTLACNWKVYVDNYLDGGYHVPHLHPSLDSVLDYTEYTIENFERVCLQASPIDDRNADPSTAAVRKGRALYYWIYPNLMLNWYEGHLDTNLVIPLGVDRCKVVFEFFFADLGAAEANAHSVAVAERIQDEDVAICESVQRGLGSRAYRAGRLSVRREAGENLFHRLLARDLRGRLNPLNRRG